MKSMKRAIVASVAALAFAALATPANAGGGHRHGGGGYRYGGGYHYGGGYRHGGHGYWRGGISIGIGWPGYYWGAPYWGAPYYGGYYAPRYYYAPPIGGYGYGYGYYGGVPAADMVERPVTYVERDDVAAAPAQNGSQSGAQNGARNGSHNWWYWCSGSRNYYPYVKDCPGGWQRVPPQPTR